MIMLFLGAGSGLARRNVLQNLPNGRRSTSSGMLCTWGVGGVRRSTQHGFVFCVERSELWWRRAAVFVRRIG